MATEICASCGNDVPVGMQYCGWCGAAIAERRETVNVHADRRLFGVPPATLLLALGLLLVAFAIVLLVTGRLPAGAVLLVAGLFLLSGFPQIARRPGESRVARGAVRSYDGVRARAGAAIDSLAIRAKARRQLGELDSDLEQLRRSREGAVSSLGEAAYREHADDVVRLRAELRAADAAIAAKESERRQVKDEVEERVVETHSAAAPTERVILDEPPPAEKTQRSVPM